MASPTTTRTDPHRLAELDPAAYRLVAYELVDDEAPDFEWAVDEWRGMNVADNSTDDHYIALGDALVGDQYRCSLCGHSHSKTWGYFEHQPTGDVITVGRICAGKFKLESRDDVIDILKARAEGRKMARVRGHFLAGNPRARQAVDIAMAEVEQAEWNFEHPGADEVRQVDSFLVDIGRKFMRYGDMSDKQVNAAWWAGERNRQRAIRTDLLEQTRAAERAAADPLPVTDDRVTVTGEVIKTETKEYDGPYGPDYRDVMTVKDDRGFVVWGTQPSAISNAERGDRVTFTARLEGSDDPYFGFFKRPTKATVVEAAVANTDGMTADQLGDILQPEPVPADEVGSTIPTQPEE